MIRSIIIATVFVGITLMLILLQPGGAPRVDPSREVTRADVDLTAVAPRSAADTAPSAANAIAAAVAAANAPKPAIRTDNSNLADMTSGVLNELGLKSESADGDSAAMRNMTASALSGIHAIRGTNGADDRPKDLQGLIVQALREGQSDKYIDALLNEAANSGKVSVPKALVTSDGRVDTSTLLANIVAKATESRASAGKKPASTDLAVGGEGVEVRMITKADGQTVQYKFYTVNRGDSLGAIAVKFYGDVSHYAAIFEANRGILSSPDRIRAGQRLVIPTI